jgi:hypothetical protein
VPQEFEVRIDRAVESLAEWDARLVVAASGDWIHYAWLAEAIRWTVLVVGGLIALAATLVVIGLVRSHLQRRHLDESAAS